MVGNRLGLISVMRESFLRPALSGGGADLAEKTLTTPAVFLLSLFGESVLGQFTLTARLPHWEYGLGLIAGVMDYTLGTASHLLITLVGRETHQESGRKTCKTRKV